MSTDQAVDEIKKSANQAVEGIKEHASPLKGSVGIVVFTVMELLVFVFVVIGTSTSQFKPRSGTTSRNMPPDHNDLNEVLSFDPCLTMWGLKPVCNGSKYSAKWSAAFGCVQRRDAMNASAAFAVGSIIFTLLAFICGVLHFAGKLKKFSAAVILTGIATFTTLVPWACVATVYNSNMCMCKLCLDFYEGPLMYYFRYGPGFSILIVSWVLQLLNFLLALVLRIL